MYRDLCIQVIQVPYNPIRVDSNVRYPFVYLESRFQYRWAYVCNKENEKHNVEWLLGEMKVCVDDMIVKFRLKNIEVHVGFKTLICFYR